MSSPRRLALVCACAALLASAAARACPFDQIDQIDSAAPPRSLDALLARIAGVLREEHVPGAGIALVTRDGVLWSGGVGMADPVNNRPVTADTLFRAGSITKTFIALAILKLVDERRLSLDARVADLAPELEMKNPWWRTHPVTVAHLLEHTAGFDDMRPSETYAPAAVESLPLADVLARNPRSRTSRWRPGSRFSYANPGYTVAAYVIEKVTGRRWDEYLQNEILAPLDIRSAALRLTPGVEPRLARGHDDDAMTPQPYRAIYHRPAGNLMVSPRELANLVSLMLHRGRAGSKQLISETAISRMERSATLALTTDNDYGLATYSAPFAPVRLRGHDGGIDGFISTYQYSAERGVGLVVLLNSTNSVPALIRVDRLVLDYLTQGARDARPPKARVPRESLDRWVGHYQFTSPRHQLLAFLAPVTGGLRVAQKDDHLELHVQGVPPIPLLPADNDRFHAPESLGSVAAFGIDGDGRRTLSLLGAHFTERPRIIAWVAPRAFLASLFVLATAFLFALVWLPRWLLRDAWQRGGLGVLLVRLPALLAAASLLAIPPLFVSAAVERSLGEPNRLTQALFASTLAFALFSALALVQAVRALGLPRRRGLGAFARTHTLLVALAASGLCLYLARYGIIGLRTWAW